MKQLVPVDEQKQTLDDFCYLKNGSYSSSSGAILHHFVVSSVSVFLRHYFSVSAPFTGQYLQEGRMRPDPPPQRL